MRRLLIVGLLALVVTLPTLACGPSGAQHEPFREFRNYTRFSNEEVWTAYRFAEANPNNALDYIPCYCGCGAVGHHNNHDCYVHGHDADGRPEYEPHAAG